MSVAATVPNVVVMLLKVSVTVTVLLPAALGLLFEPSLNVKLALLDAEVCGVLKEAFHVAVAVLVAIVLYAGWDE